MSQSYQLQQFDQDVKKVLAENTDFRSIIDGIKPYLGQLLTNKQLLPQEYRQPKGDKYAQYLLYKPEDESYSVIAFVWGPGQISPVHDHLIWGLVGIYEGAIVEKRYRQEDRGEGQEPRYELREVGEVTAKAGDISFVYPPNYDIHSVANPFEQTAIAIHVYGADVGERVRHIHDINTGEQRDVITKHDNATPIYKSFDGAEFDNA
ncbi:cysteine dioxygenase family protein [Cohnella abietis]|uniref:Cysteine dioxygenase n=1 Tax=Cohnella abietis TaxID=2507935 RepID=A0A3T1CZ76_9BACL|nr:cysteine dioxygenase [Cohnella abietis]BBI31134.1 cysteine dioxygenase [Cohnella abietis]